MSWLDSDEAQLTLFENDAPIIFRRNTGTLVLSAQLLCAPYSQSQLNAWLRLGGVSLNHFGGALARAPDNGALWLIQCVHEGRDQGAVHACLQSLLNQRDTWRAVTSRINRPAQYSPLLARCRSKQRTLHALHPS